jgi:hypothetical protein
MSKDKKTTINVRGTEITILSKFQDDFISLSDMVRHFEGGTALIEQWLRNKDTIEFLAVWEQLNNPGFNSPEFEGIRNQAGTNRFYLSAKKWIEKTNAKGLIASPGRYGGTFAHKDTAMAMFGKTAAQWRKENPGKEGNIRDYSTIEQLLVLTNLESLNAEFIRMKIPLPERLVTLNSSAISQLKSLTTTLLIKRLNKKN